MRTDFATGLCAAIVLGFLCCAHPQTTTSATAQTQSEGSAGTQAAAGVQAESTARVQVKRGARHFNFSLKPAADGGAPELNFAVDDDPDVITAGASGEVDAGAASEADAGAQSEADAGAVAHVEPPAPFFTTGKLFLLLLLGVVAVAFVVLRKLGRL